MAEKETRKNFKPKLLLRNYSGVLTNSNSLIIYL